MHSRIEDYLKGKSFLITGASGYLASNLASSLKNISCKIRRLTRKNKLASLEGNAVFENVQGEISDRTLWDRAIEDVDIIFHFAGQTSVYVAEENPIIDYEANVLPMLHILEACKKNGARPDILFAGTSTQMGLPKSLPVNETCLDKPITIYDTHKCMAENYLKYYARMGFVRGTTLRLTNVYGPGPKSSSKDRGMLNAMIRRALSGENLTLYGDGKYIRDYIYMEDIVAAFLLASGNMDSLNEKHFVIGSGQGHSISEVLHQIAKQAALKTGKPVDIKSISPPPGLSPIEERYFIANPKTFSKITGWQPKYSLSKGIDQTLESFIHHSEP